MGSVNQVYSSNTVADGGDDSDEILIGNYIEHTSINAGTGDDLINNHGNNGTIFAGDGDDYFVEYGNSNLIDMGNGDDFINLIINYTIVDAQGNETPVLKGENDTLVYGAGNDTVRNYTESIVVQVTSGTIQNSITSGSNVTFNFENGSLTFLNPQTSNFNFVFENAAPANSFTYSGGNQVIGNYQSGAIFNFSATYTGWMTEGNDLIITAAEGSVRIQEATNKLVEFAVGGNVIAHVFKAEGYEGALDGRGFGGYEVIVGSDNQSNQIYSNEVGASLWGGRGNSNDELHGNSGVDEFIYAYGNGQDIFNAGAEDIVNLLNTSIEQIASAEFTDNGISAKFTDGGSLTINGQAGTFKLGGYTFRADYQNKTFA